MLTPESVPAVPLRNTLFAVIAGVLLFGAVYAFQRPWREYPGAEYENFPIPPDYQEKTEWAFARLMYPAARRRSLRQPGLDQGLANWTIDYPRSDRHLSAGAAPADANPRAFGRATRQPR